jgi:uncharacterized protein YggE
LVSKQRITNAGMLTVALVLIATSIYMAVGSAQTAGTTNTTTQNNNTLNVSGTGVATIAPDEAQVTIGAITQAATAQDAAAANSKISNSVIAQLESMGISSQSIVTISYNIWPNYGQGANQQQIITGYQASTELQVTVTDSNLTKLGSMVGRIIDSATGAGANQVYGIQFSATPQTTKNLNAQALQLAVQDASSKAQTMAGALGVKILGVQSATENTPYNPPIYYAAQADKGTPIQPGTFSLTASVQVTYAIQ